MSLLSFICKKGVERLVRNHGRLINYPDRKHLLRSLNYHCSKDSDMSLAIKKFKFVFYVNFFLTILSEERIIALLIQLLYGDMKL